MNKSEKCPVFQPSQDSLDIYLAIATCRDSECDWWSCERGTCGCMLMRRPVQEPAHVGALAALRRRLQGLGKRRHSQVAQTWRRTA